MDPRPAIDPTWLMAWIGIASVLINIGISIGIARSAASHVGRDVAAIARGVDALRTAKEEATARAAGYHERLERAEDDLTLLRDVRDVLSKLDARLAVGELEIRQLREWRHDIVSSKLQEHENRLALLERDSHTRRGS